MTSPRFRLSAVGLRLTALFVLFGATALFAADKKSFNLPAGDAAATLKAFAEQSGEQVVYPVEQVKGVKTKAVSGNFTAREALDAMLADSGLHIDQDAKTGALAVTKNGKNDPRAAQTDSDRPGQKLKVEDGVVKMDAFEVFGSKSINLDLPRTRDDVQPYVVFGYEQIENSQATNLQEFLRTRLTMANASGPNPIASNVNLRGLGSNQTLILVDGRRMPGFTLASAGPGRGQPDLNAIPLAMVERIEILPSTASGIYGGEATGGVINIITRKDFSGGVLTFDYVNSTDSDSGQFRADLAWSTSLRGGATQLSLTASYADGNEMQVRDRSFAQRARNLAFANNPAAVTGPYFPLIGFTPNIRSEDGENLVLKPQYGGRALNSPITSVPAGYAGIASDNAAALVANAGRYSLALPDDSGGLRAPLATNAPLKSVGLSLRQKITPWLEAYVDASRSESRVSTLLLPGETYTTLDADAPNNPFTTAVNVAFPGIGLRGESSFERTNSRVTGGLVAKLPGDWTVGLDYTWGRFTSLRRTVSDVLGDPDGEDGPRTDYYTALATGELDVLRDLNVRPPNYSPYLVANNGTDNRASSNARMAAARASGPVFELPAGPVVLSASAGWNEDVVDDSVNTRVDEFLPGYAYQWFPGYSGNNRSGYLETRIPLLAPLAGAPKQPRLELQLAARYDASHYRTWAGFSAPSIPSPTGPFPPFNYVTRDFHATSWTGGLRYQPIPSLTLRASGGTGFLAPALTQLANSFSIPNTTLTVVDPKRGGISRTYTGVRQFVLGGNPSLQPEDSQSVSAGLIFAPRSWPGLRISVDYTKITKTDEITTLTTDQLFAYEDLFPGEIVRAPLTPADQALGYTGGVVTSYSVARAQNIARKVVEALDFQVDYTRRTSLGEFVASAVATTNLAFESKITPGSQVLNAVGFSDGPMRWRLNAGLDWSRGPWFAGWNAQYYAPIRIYASTFPAGAVTSAVRTQGSDRFPGQVFHDVRVGYQFKHGGEGWRRLFSDLRIRVGIQNVFNRDLALRAGTDSTGGYQSLEDPRLRRYSINLQKQF